MTASQFDVRSSPKSGHSIAGADISAVQNQTSRKSIGARLCIRKQQSGANHSAEPTLIYINAALSIADDFLPDKTVCPFVQPCALGVCLEHEDFIMPTQHATRSARQSEQKRSRKRLWKRGARNIPSACRIANIAMILPYDATPSRMEFSERTSGGGAINAPAHRGSAGAAVHRQQKRRVDLHVVDTAADQLVEGFGA